jgi:site-specific recombinase
MAPRDSTLSFDDVLPLDEFLGRFALVGPARPAAAELYALLMNTPVAASAIELTTWFEALVRWITEPRADDVPLRGAKRGEEPRTGRLRALILVLDKCEPFRRRMILALRQLVGRASTRRLLVAIGLSHHRTFFAEVGARLGRRFVPDAPEPLGLGWAIRRACSTPEAVSWLSEVPADAWVELVRTLQPAGETPVFEPLDAAAREAVSVLATRAAALGLSDEILDRSREVRVRESPFLTLTQDALAALEGREGALARFELTLAQCRDVITLVSHHLQTEGMSLDLVFRLEALDKTLHRVEEIARLGSRRGDTAAAFRLLAHCLQEAAREQSVGALVGRSSAPLARKVIESNGAVGEHYITGDARQWRRMFLAAAGGGALTAFTTWAKFALAGLALPLLWNATFNSANYALSFVLIQLLGFTLAITQPSRTAAALAQSMGTGHDYRETATLVAKIARSQFAALLGNLGAVIPIAFGANALVEHLRGAPILTAEKARSVIEQLDVTRGSTWVYGALTGVFLWVASLSGGVVENWVKYRRLPTAIAHVRWFRRLVGPRRANAFGEAIKRHASGLGTSVVLGVLLAWSPVMSAFTGLPLDARHVTLSTGSLTLALTSLGLSAEGIDHAVGGIGLIGLLNFGVSFALALLAAMGARQVTLREKWKLLRALGSRFFWRPLSFFLPPGRGQVSALERSSRSTVGVPESD